MSKKISNCRTFENKRRDQITYIPITVENEKMYLVMKFSRTGKSEMTTIDKIKIEGKEKLNEVSILEGGQIGVQTVLSC